MKFCVVFKDGKDLLESPWAKQQVWFGTRNYANNLAALGRVGLFATSPAFLYIILEEVENKELQYLHYGSPNTVRTLLNGLREQEGYKFFTSCINSPKFRDIDSLVKYAGWE